MHYISLCKLYIRKYFVRMLNSRAIKFANISENKVLSNNSEFTVNLKQACLTTKLAKLLDFGIYTVTIDASSKTNLCHYILFQFMCRV